MTLKWSWMRLLNKSGTNTTQVHLHWAVFWLYLTLPTNGTKSCPSGISSNKKTHICLFHPFPCYQCASFRLLDTRGDNDGSGDRGLLSRNSQPGWGPWLFWGPTSCAWISTPLSSLTRPRVYHWCRLAEQVLRYEKIRLEDIYSQKANMEPKNELLEKEIPFRTRNHHFQVPFYFFRVYHFLIWINWGEGILSSCLP